MTYPTTLDRSFAPPVERPSFNTAPAAIAAALIALGAIYLNAAVSGRQALLFLVGAGAGVVLYHAAFGFTSSWREFLLEGRGAGIRAQMLMLALTCLVFFPVLGIGHVGGQAVRGSVSPVGVSVVVGAFLFGVGMQLAGGCASGTLYTAGGGNTRMLATLAAFIAGSVIGTAHAPWWSARTLAAAGVDVSSWPYWAAPAQAASLKAAVIVDVTSVMDLGIVLGALAAAASAGRFAPTWRVPVRSLAAAIIGGLFLGYGARIAYGCNIGAYFSGIASGSVHGWLWMVAAFGGNAAGAFLRPIFGLRR